MMPTCFRRSPNRVSTTTDAPRARSHMGLHKRVQKPRGRHSGIIGRTRQSADRNLPIKIPRHGSFSLDLRNDGERKYDRAPTDQIHVHID